MSERAKNRLEVLEHLRTELERVRAQAEELHRKIIDELRRVELASVRTRRDEASSSYLVAGESRD